MGGHPTDETRQKVSEAGKGRHYSEETRKKRSISLTGRHYSEEARKRISAALSGEKNPWYGKHPSEETIKKRSESLKGRLYVFNLHSQRRVRIIDEEFQNNRDRYCGFRDRRYKDFITTTNLLPITA